MDYTALASGLIGAAIGALSSWVTLIVQNHYQNQRDRTRLLYETAYKDYELRILRLPDNVATFPAFASAADVPERGVSVGLATIAGARRLRLVLHGADKRAAAERVTALDDFDPSWPASIVHACEDAEIWLDEAAAA